MEGITSEGKKKKDEMKGIRGYLEIPPPFLIVVPNYKML